MKNRKKQDWEGIYDYDYDLCKIPLIKLSGKG